MKNKKKTRDNQAKKTSSSIPDLEIIDLEDTVSMDTEEQQEPEASPKSRRRFSHVYAHIAFFVVVLACVVFIIYRFTNWGVYVDLDEIFKDGSGTVNDTLDQFFPLTDANRNTIYQEYNEDSIILAFGNAPFADDRNSKDNLVTIIQGMTDAKVYNCSISGSCLAAESPELDVENFPWDAFTFYRLSCLATNYGEHIESDYLKAVEILGEDAPEEAMEVYNTLKAIDMSRVDVVVVMYDASDYLAGHTSCNLSDSTDSTTFTGNMEAGIECFQVFYPNIRIIVLSPAYAYGIDENGAYISSDIQDYGGGMLSHYVHLQSTSCLNRGVTFVDNLYGTIHEDNADKYLTDHLHLNVAGRKKVARRFINALDYFQQ